MYRGETIQGFHPCTPCFRGGAKTSCKIVSSIHRLGLLVVGAVLPYAGCGQDAIHTQVYHIGRLTRRTALAYSI